ncbi:hypothetical protein L195_g024241, partial [Trifolium pratense]
MSEEKNRGWVGFVCFEFSLPVLMRTREPDVPVVRWVQVVIYGVGGGMVVICNVR